MSGKLKAPFTYFGGKSRAASDVWARFGDVANYVEPFAGSLAVLLARPIDGRRCETVNDKDGFITNFWRATQADPDGVAGWADWPVNESDLHARHIWLCGQRESLTDRLMGDPGFYDIHAAGWWLWGVNAWIGGAWCKGVGPWDAVDSVLTNVGRNAGVITRNLPYLSGYGRGLNSLYMKPDMSFNGPRHVMKQLGWRLRDVRVACGDWKRVVSIGTLTKGTRDSAVFLDPPYDGFEDVYTEGAPVAKQAFEWCREHGDNPSLKIALCGYENEAFRELEASGWELHRWKAPKGYQRSDSMGRFRETIAFSPHCLKPADGDTSLC